MKTIRLLVTLMLALTGPLAAITLADLAPGALPGKTLEFTFEGGDAVPPPSGKWTGTFEKNPANGFTISNFPGKAGTYKTTWAYVGAPFPDSHGYALSSSPVFGNKTATLTMWISVPGVRFYLTVDGVGSYGGVTFKSAKGPEIGVQQPVGSNLSDGVTKRSFGTVVPGKSGTPKTFTIKNTGTANLSGLVVRKSGANAAEFVVGPLSKTTLPPGGSATFTVTFKPKAKGTRIAALAIASNDADENPFNIGLSGAGAAK